METARRVVIRGRVQGVWFRAWTVQEASLRALSGWVRNRTDGSVEALFAGPEAAVEEMIVLCKEGPPAARVADVAAELADPPAETGFHQLPTA